MKNQDALQRGSVMSVAVWRLDSRRRIETDFLVVPRWSVAKVVVKIA
jgi:hypothetical protein